MAEIHPLMLELVAARKRAGLSASEVARRMDVTRQHVFNWEAGRNRPALETLVAYARAAGSVMVMQVVDAADGAALGELSPDEWRRLLRYAHALRVAEPAHLQVLELTLDGLIAQAAKGRENGNGSGS